MAGTSLYRADASNFSRRPLFAGAGLLLAIAGSAQAGWRYSTPGAGETAPQPARSEEAVRGVVTTGEMPRRGVMQRRVLSEIGEPEMRIPPVGRPPISRWQYPAFIVYFERDRVITTVPR